MHELEFAIPEPDQACAQVARFRQSQLTKPRGSLGRLEELAIQCAAWQAADEPCARPAAALLFAADHAVVQHGITPYPSAVTRAMLDNFAAGGAAANVLCRSLRIPLTVFDVGVDGSPKIGPRSAHARLIRTGAAQLPAHDLARGEALPVATCWGAIEAGRRAVAEHAAGCKVLILGEMGIGNTTPAAAIAAALIGGPVDEFVGPGSGSSPAQLERKRAIVRRAVAALPAGATPLRVLQRLGGREIAALLGAMGAALERRIVVLVDGFVVGAAALLLLARQPQAAAGLVFCHRSREPGHAKLLASLRVAPLLDLQLALGEGSGALLGFALLEQACLLHRQMATFASASVPDPEADAAP
jgi:nicotinate-nucleotide--dimethylbenzimidazole phosphoribosyltransferase